MKDAMEAGLKIAVCNTSDEQAARAVTKKIFKDINFDLAPAGEFISKKKLDPEIYNFALSSWV